MDQQKLRNLVFEKTGVKLDSNDPIFALVALNETVLAEAVERHVALLDEATHQLAAQVRLLQDAAALIRHTHADGARETASDDQLLHPPSHPALRSGGAPAIDKRLIAGACVIALISALLSALLTVGLQWLFSR
jgi:hypothetical protein